MRPPSLISVIFATGFGSGFWPWGPGTAGALLATLMWWVLGMFVSPIALIAITAVAIVLFTVIGIRATDAVEPLWGPDPHKVVIDEMVGVWIPLLAAGHDWRLALASFLLFRFFDIVKPFGIRSLDKKNGGLWVMADDILAGVYSLIIVFALRWVI